MNRKTLQAAVALAFLAPAAALAQHFDAVDAIPLAASGRFPAYGTEPLRPTDIYLRAGLARDSNIFRLGDAAATGRLLGTDSRADTVYRFGAGIRHEARVVGRQRVALGANIDRYTYDRHDVLNHNAYGLRGEWLWEFTNDLAGTLGYERRSRLADLSQRQRPVRDMITEDHFFATAGYMVGPNFRIRGGLDAAKANHSDTAFQAAGARTRTVTGGAEYVTPLGNAAGVELRRTQGNFPAPELITPTAPAAPVVLVDNEFTEKEVAGVLTWAVSPQLRAVGRVGRTVRNHVQFPARDFTGTTGRATIDWTPFNKTGFEFAVYREPRTIVDIAAGYVVVKGASFGPRWAPTEKLVFSGLVLTERHSYGGDPGPFVDPTLPARQETVRGLRIGGSWEPQRFYLVQLGWDTGTRSSNIPLRDYDYNALMLNLRVAF